MFPEARKAKVDTEALGAKMLKRKIDLMEKMGMSVEGGDTDVPAARAAKR